jgi:hypothetical protein
MLSQSELNQLKRNYENYLKLSPERKEQLFRLHDELEQDAKNGGHLQKLLREYNLWFSKLSPFDREKLLSTVDPGERAQLVQKLREEQKQRLSRAGRIPFAPFLAGRFDEIAQLNSNDLDVVWDAVAQKFLKEDTKKRLSRTSAAPRDRHLQIIRLTMDQLRHEREAGTKMGPSETALIDVMLDAMPNETVKSRITRSGLPREIRRQMGQIVGRSILAEWKPELDDAPATPTQIEETTNRFLAVATTERREVMQQRLQTENGRRYVALMAALQTNPRLKRQRQAVGWLLRGLPAPPANRQNGAPARPTTSAAGATENDSSSTESN